MSIIKSQIIYITVVCCALGSLLSCAESDVTPAPHLAVEAWIDSGGYPVVIVSQALAPSADETKISDAMVRWAKVTISDGVDTVVMTGGVDRTVMPPFSYRTFMIEGSVGAEYTITVDYEGQRLTARSTILPPPEITDITFTADGNGGGYTGEVTFTPPACDDTCRFVLLTKVRNRDTRHYLTLLGAASTPPGCRSHVMPLLPGKNAVDEYSAVFEYGDTIDVILARVEPQVYRYWDDYRSLVYFGDNVFISTGSSPRGNVDGGAGVFSARGISRRLVIVK